MFLAILEFAVVTIGVKCALGAAIVYYLLPTDRRCVACDGETIPLRARRGLGGLGRLASVEQRFCLACGRTMVARRRAGVVAAPAKAATPPVEKTAEG